MKKVYVCSPFSHKFKKVMRDREKEINRIAAELIYKYKVALFLPITQSAPLERIIPALGGSFEKWRDIDLEWVKTCDELWVVMMEGWKDSIGVTAEIEYARELKKDVRFIDPNDPELFLRFSSNPVYHSIQIKV